MGITSMVHPMMRWCHKEIFNRLRELLDIFSVDPELIQYSDLVTNKEDEWIKAHQHHWYKKDNLYVLRPS
ncbi:hypothetical protein ADICYQ_0936 [Cyclobacterium qasimii M12-11B]|uniref:Uncharacterized protein n=1 Tax=Cyclobacterium qasimii M12-11B TaxID=641524 RepID=S7VM41_9BACT|nr:hypothetical protein ADICYQ_0936 [Cyclobacterium qasimii M12-11B]